MRGHAPHYTGPMSVRLARRLAVAALGAVLLLAPRGAGVEAATTLGGNVAGFELCPQEVCGAAVFLGAFQGTLDGVDNPGGWWVAVNHEPLPLAGGNAAITGGRWELSAGDRDLYGGVASGTIRNNGDGTFTVTPLLALRGGGDGTLTLDITLDHRAFPPAVTGRLDAGSGGEAGGALARVASPWRSGDTAMTPR